MTGFMVNGPIWKIREHIAYFFLEKGYDFETIVIDSGDFDGASEELKDEISDMFDELKEYGSIAFNKKTEEMKAN
jgi:hypothetical protein